MEFWLSRDIPEYPVIRLAMMEVMVV